MEISAKKTKLLCRVQKSFLFQEEYDKQAKEDGEMVGLNIKEQVFWRTPTSPNFNQLPGMHIKYIHTTEADNIYGSYILVKLVEINIRKYIAKI